MTGTKYVGWFRRRGHPWGKVTEAATATAALDALLELVPKLGSGDMVVLPDGRHPTDRERRLSYRAGRSLLVSGGPTP